MSSRRFPGKVLAPFRGEPLIVHVIRKVTEVIQQQDVIVTTSDQASDDPLALYLEGKGVQVFRGPLDNVFERFRLCLAQHPCDWILRISADSPLLDTNMLQRVIAEASREECDLITTIFPRTFPRGNNAELIKTPAFLAIPREQLTTEDQEHVTPYFYRNSNRYRIRNVESGSRELAELSLAVDEVEDLQRIEQWTETYSRPQSSD